MNPEHGNKSQKAVHGRITESYEWEMRILQAIVDLASNKMEPISVYDLTKATEIENEFDMKMWLLTLSGKGLIQATACGFILTEKGRSRLNKI